MMSYEQWLLCKLAEECAEVAQQALKCQQFGFDSVNPFTGLSSRESLHKELNDVMGVLRLLNEETPLNFEIDEDAIRRKHEALNYYGGISRQNGKIQ